MIWVDCPVLVVTLLRDVRSMRFAAEKYAGLASELAWHKQDYKSNYLKIKYLYLILVIEIQKPQKGHPFVSFVNSEKCKLQMVLRGGSL